MKSRIANITTRFVGAGLLTVAAFVSVEQKTFAADPPTDPAHAAHVAAGAMPPDAAKNDPALAQQVSQLRAKVAQLETALAKISPPMALRLRSCPTYRRWISFYPFPCPSPERADVAAPGIPGMAAPAEAAAIGGEIFASAVSS